MTTTDDYVGRCQSVVIGWSERLPPAAEVQLTDPDEELGQAIRAAFTVAT